MEKIAPLSDWIDEIEVSANRIATYMRSLLIDTDVDDEGYLLLKNGLEHPAWIYLDKPRTLVHLIAQVPLQIHCCHGDAYAGAVNELNTGFVGVQFHTLDGALWANAWLSYKTGMCLRHLAHIVPLFASAVLHAVHEPCIREMVLRAPRRSH